MYAIENSLKVAVAAILAAVATLVLATSVDVSTLEGGQSGLVATHAVTASSPRA